MKFLYAQLLMLCFLACKKNAPQITNPNSSPYDHTYLGWADVVSIDYSCSENPVLIRIKGSFDEGVFYSFTSDTEFWTYDLPDSLKALGQTLEIKFTPIPFSSWTKCSTGNFLPNQIEVNRVNPIMGLEFIEIISVDAGCRDLVLAKVSPYYKNGSLLDRAYCVKLPDSLKVVGRRIKGWLRFAGTNETIKCKDLKPIAQITLSEPEAW